MQIAFIGGVLDVIEVLRKDNNIQLGHEDLSAKVICAISQVAFSLSIGFRFVFYWLFVGQPIIRRQLISHSPDIFGNSRQDYVIFTAHWLTATSPNIAWKRWGFSGTFTKWCILALCCVVAALQGVWRLDDQLTRDSIIYVTESTIEMVLSALLLLIHTGPEQRI